MFLRTSKRRMRIWRQDGAWSADCGTDKCRRSARKQRASRTQPKIATTCEEELASAGDNSSIEMH